MSQRITVNLSVDRDLWNVLRVRLDAHKGCNSKISPTVEALVRTYLNSN